MSEERCSVCGRSLTRCGFNTANDEYELTFSTSVCRLCGVTLSRGLEGIVEMLRQSHNERRERVLDRLITRLESSGFDRSAFPRRRTA